MGGHGDRGNLSFIAHLSQKKSDESSAKNAKALGDLSFLFFYFVGDHGPNGHPDK